VAEGTALIPWGLGIGNGFASEPHQRVDYRQLWTSAVTLSHYRQFMFQPVLGKHAQRHVERIRILEASLIRSNAFSRSRSVSSGTTGRSSLIHLSRGESLRRCRGRGDPRSRCYTAFQHRHSYCSLVVLLCIAVTNRNRKDTDASGPCVGGIWRSCSAL